MGLAELITAVGEDKVRFQNLDQCAITLNWSAKNGGRISFRTEQTITPGQGTDQLGLVVWLDREAVAAAIAQAKEVS